MTRKAKRVSASHMLDLDEPLAGTSQAKTPQQIAAPAGKENNDEPLAPLTVETDVVIEREIVDDITKLDFSNMIVQAEVVSDERITQDKKSKRPPKIVLNEEQQKEYAPLKTKSSKVRYLHAQGFSRSQIAYFLNIIYQHVRNVLVTPLKRTDSQPQQTDGDETDDNE